MSLAVLVPVLGRPQRVRPLLEAFQATTPAPYRVLFITDPDDTTEREAVAVAGAEELVVAGGYPVKINAGIAATDEPLIFLGADDIEPQPGWLDAAKAELQGEIGVVGVNDLIERTRPGREEHATHFLMARWYAALGTIDGRPGVVYEGYTHSFCDDELIGTAKARGAYVYAPNAKVHHDHPMSGAPDDDTYRKGRQHFRRDRRLYQQRMKLWPLST